MNRLLHFFILGLSISTAIMLPKASAGVRADTWLERPWEIRYVLFAQDSASAHFRIKMARTLNARHRHDKPAPLYFQAESLLKPLDIAVPKLNHVAVSVVQFNTDGRVVGTGTPRYAMLGKRNLLDDLVLVHEDRRDRRKFLFAHWSQGVPGEITFSPAVCISLDRDRYAQDWDFNELYGGFGCREWTAQLYDASLPYINVTSYTEHGNFIGQFIGWSRFTDPPKPVIGQQGTTWLCLHECPDGEAPGIIPDIGAWTTKHGYPMPTPPVKQPEYPDADFDWSQC